MLIVNSNCIVYLETISTIYSYCYLSSSSNKIKKSILKCHLNIPVFLRDIFQNNFSVTDNIILCW